MTTNADLTARARAAMPGGVAHELRWRPEPIYVTHAEGALKWDAEGRRIIDFKMGSASQMLGHSHPDVVAAVAKQAALTPFTADCHLAEVEWAEAVNALYPSADMTRFTGSGTEATMLALRLGRAHSGRDRVLRIDGHYHGWHDHALKGAKPGKAGPPSLGVPESVSDLITVAPADLSSVEGALDDAGAIIVEVSGANYGAVPLPAGFLAGLRRLADQAGVVLIFDEIITGFRWAPGGLQARDGITPDLTTLSKILTGGLPGGAVAGRAEIMELLDPGLERDGFSPPVSHKGTFNASPLVAAGAVAAMAHLKTGAPQAAADRAAAALRDGLAGIMRERRISGAVYGESSTFHLFFGDCDGSVDGLTPAQIRTPPPSLIAGLRRELMARGVDLMSQTSGVTSAAHDDAIIDEALIAFDGAFGALRAEGII